MRWCIVLGLFVLTSCGGGASSKKSSAAKVSDDASNPSSSGASAEFVTVNVELFDNSELTSYVSDVSAKMNAYQLSFVVKNDDCDEEDQVITGDLNQNFSVEVDISRNCVFDVFLSYGYAPDAAGAAANPSDGSADGTDAGGTDGNSGGAALVTYEGAGGVKEYLDMTCALSGCHSTGATDPDLSSFEVIDANKFSISDSLDRMKGDGNIMPPGGTPENNADAIALLEGWVANEYAQGGAALALTNVTFQTAYYESEPIALTKNILDSHDLLTLKFKLCRTSQGEAVGFSAAAVECIQGGSYKRASSGGSNNGGSTDASTIGSTDGGNMDGGTDGGADDGDTDAGADPNDIVGDPNSTLTFDDVQDLFITNPAAAVEGCTASGCHGAENKGINVSSDYSTWENVVAAEEANPGSIMLYLKMDLMPKTTPYGAEDKQKIADWIAAGMPAGAPAVPDPNAVITSQVAALFAADKGNCVDAGCHGGTIAPNLLGDVNLKAGAVQALARLDAYAAGNANPMPQAGTGIDLLPAELEMIRTWIAAGMPDVAPPAAQ